MSHPKNPRLTKPTNEAAAEIVMDAIREAGLDPRKVGNDAGVRLAYQKWIDGEIDRSQFVESIRNLR